MKIEYWLTSPMAEIPKDQQPVHRVTLVGEDETDRYILLALAAMPANKMAERLEMLIRQYADVPAQDFVPMGGN